ncbi:TonB-dependent receptor family protein [Sphingobacterium sp. SRCM116780]|uniref:outer membrane beta-barrel family protein n=1 Tax=Sphingobacterium sp. SRCM116780 TaxID=2907623 RepID=UPI001F161EF6|nr:outer membrane beta-barrel family protein [Sphingobacterium sp. SRCM116780]UIR55515.1 TonB-dependent receptor family protein [Sphingobacterium sp. SRCM116780]
MFHYFRYFISLFLVSTLLFAHAQQSTKVIGQIIDQNTEAVPYVQVSLHHVHDGTVAKVIVADSTGNFMFPNPSFGNYYVRINSMTYQDIFSPHFRLNEFINEYNLGKIILQQNNAYLAEVVINKRKQFIEQQQDKTVFNIENSALADGNNGLELLAKIPGIAVDDHGTFSIKGKSGASIMINGKLTYLSADQLANLLRSTSSADINKIEVMSNPNAKQDAAGTSGIINIVLKKGLKQGFNGAISGNIGAGRGLHLGGSVNLNFRTEKINAFGSYNQYFQNLRYYNSLTRYFHKDSQAQPKTFSQQENKIQPKLRSNNFRVGMDFYLSPKQTLGFLVNGGLGKYPKHEPTTTQFRNFETKDLIWLASTITAGKERWEDMLYNINYNLKFNESGHELKIDFDLIDHYSKMDQTLTTQHSNENQNNIRPLSSRIGDIPSDNKVYVAKIDYSLPLAEQFKLETGWKTSHIRTENDLQYDTLQNGNYVPDLSTSNHFIYKETIQAGYINLSKTWNKISTQVGLRAEYTSTNGNQITIDEQFSKDYLKLFPSAFISYSLNTNHKLQLGYSYRVERPSFWDLNPFRVYTDPFSYSEGNATLDPAYEHAFEMNYTLVNKYMFTLNYANRSDVVNEIIGIDPTNAHITYEKPENIGSFRNYGISFIAPMQIVSWWTATYFANFYQNAYEIPQENQLIKRAGNTLTLNTQNNFKLPKDWSLELGGNYMSGLTVGLSKIKSYGLVYTGIQKNILNKKATVKLVVNDIFRTNNRRFETVSNTVRLIGRSNPDSRTAILSFNYRFGGSDNSIKQRSTGSEEIKNRL